MKIHDLAYYFPFVALSARYDQDSGDGDGDKHDMVQDALREWLPHPTIGKHVEPRFTDVTYLVETTAENIIIYLGTQRRGWWSNFNPFGIKKYGGHKGFIKAGQDTFGFIARHINRDKPTTGVSHSRGSARNLVVSKLMYETYRYKINTLCFNGPPVFNRKSAQEYNTYEIPTKRITTPNDFVDDILARIFLQHVGEHEELPKTDSPINTVPGGGHAYSVIFDGLIKKYLDEKKFREVDYLRERKWVCTI